jgi:hypothetical protein
MSKSLVDDHRTLSPRCTAVPRELRDEALARENSGWLMVGADPEVLRADLDPEWRALVIEA